MTYDEKLARYHKLELKLNPPAPVVSENQHTLAAARYAFESVLSDLYGLHTYVNIKEGTANPQELKHYNSIEERKPGYFAQDALAATKRAEIILNAEKIEPWDGIDTTWIREALSEMHIGDCVAFPATCTRCFAESLYRIPSTAPWHKHDGYALFKEYEDLREELGLT